MPDDRDVVLLTLPRGDRGELRLCRSQYQGSVFTKLQLWYPTDSGDLKPGRQVVTLRDGELGEVIKILEKIRRRAEGGA